MLSGEVTAIFSKDFLNSHKIDFIITSFTHYKDQELLAFVQQGNEQAFTELYHRYYKPLYLKAFKRVPFTPIVEEMVQDVFLNLWVKAASLDVQGNVRAYLYATLRNKILFELRTEQRRIYYMQNTGGTAGDATANNDAGLIYAKETEEQINHIIATLSPQCRAAFLYSRYDELSYKEIAERMHLSVNTVEKHIAKALRILRSKLNPYDAMVWILVFVSLSGH